MGKKCRKPIALLVMLAMILQFSFGAGFFSVYAEDVQGEANAKAASSEDVSPAADPTPASEPEKPTPSDSGNTGNSGDSGNQDAESGNDAGTNGDSGGDSTGTGDGSSDTPGDTSGNDSDDPSANNDDSSSDDSDVVTDPDAIDATLLEEEIIEEEEESYPEDTRSVNVGGVTITVHAPEGALPEGFKVSAHSVNSQAVIGAVEQRVESEGKEFTGALAFDIKTLTKDGETVQPKKAVTVTFSGTNISGSDIDVFHVSGDGSSVSEVGTSIATSGKQQFSASHFSIYVVAGESESTVPEEDQGDGQTESTSYILEYGDSVTLDSDEGSFYSGWSIQGPNNYQRYVSVNGLKVTNHNPDNGSAEIIILHTYRNWETNSWGIPYIGGVHYEYFYITALPAKVDVTVMLQRAGESNFSQYDKYTVHKGDKITKPALPDEDEDGNKLYGWYTESACQTDFDFDTPVTGNLTLYGKYTPTTTITYYKNTDEAATVPEPLKGGAGTTVTLGSGSQSGYTFAGWNTDPLGEGTHFAGGQTITMPSENIALYAEWSNGSENKIVIHYHENSPRPFAADRIIHSESNIRKNWQTTLWDGSPEVAPYGAIRYIFRGWATSANASNPQYYPGTTFQTGERNVELYAVWATFSLNSLTGITAESATYVYDGIEHEISEVSGGLGTRIYRGEKYILVGRTMFLGQDIYAKVENIRVSGTNVGHYSTPITAPLYYEERLTGALLRLDIAPYMEVGGGKLIITKCEVTINTFDAEKLYDGDPLTGEGEAVFTEGETEKSPTFDYEGGTVTLVNGETLNIRTIGSQTDVGTSDNTFKFDWGKPDDWGTTASTAKKFNYDIKTGTVGTLTVYLGVVFDKNAGSDTVTGMPKNLKITDLEDAALPGDKPARDGYDFLGWAKDAGATKADYQPGAKLTMNDFSDAGKDGLVLYAVWKAKEEPTPSPVTPGDDNAAGGGGAGGDGAADGDGAAIAAADAAQTILDNATPEAATINDNAAPKSAPTSHWALLNLIAAILTIIGSLIAAFRKNSATTVVKGVGLAAAAAGVIVFLVTQNLGAPMQIADGWTILMAALFGVQCVTTGITAKTPAVDD